MFDAYCPTHDSRVLLTPSRIVRLEQGAHGVVVHFRCWCGTPGTIAPAAEAAEAAGHAEPARELARIAG